MSLVKIKGKFHVSFLPFNLSMGLGHVFFFNFSALWHQWYFLYTLSSDHKALIFSVVSQQYANQTSSQIQGLEDINFNFHHEFKVTHFACVNLCSYQNREMLRASFSQPTILFLTLCIAVLMGILLSTSRGFDQGLQLCLFLHFFIHLKAVGLSFPPSCSIFRCK